MRVHTWFVIVLRCLPEDLMEDGRKVDLSSVGCRGFCVSFFVCFVCSFFQFGV